MIWEFINPSDAIVFEAADEELAALVTIIVGRGQYGAKNGDKPPVGLFSFGPREDCHKWFIQEFGHDADASFELRKAELPAVLRSFMLGHERDIACYNAALKYIPDDKQPAFKREWKETRRSSMNDICGFAWQMANRLEGKKENSIPEPRSVFSY